MNRHDSLEEFYFKILQTIEKSMFVTRHVFPAFLSSFLLLSIHVYSSIIIIIPFLFLYAQTTRSIKYNAQQEEHCQRSSSSPPFFFILCACICVSFIYVYHFIFLCLSNFFAAATTTF
jgi:hypothetical protein